MHHAAKALVPTRAMRHTHALCCACRHFLPQESAARSWRAYRRGVPHALGRAEGARPAGRTIFKTSIGLCGIQRRTEASGLGGARLFLRDSCDIFEDTVASVEGNYSANDRQSRNRAGKTSFIELGLR